MCVCGGETVNNSCCMLENELYWAHKYWVSATRHNQFRWAVSGPSGWMGGGGNTESRALIRNPRFANTNKVKNPAKLDQKRTHAPDEKWDSLCG